MPEDALFPNRIRELRLAASMTRERLAAATAALAAEDPVAYSSVTARSLEALEQGRTRPRVRTAAALAKALGSEAADVFPHGPDDGMRNPVGNTRVPPARSPRGPGRQKRA